MNRHQLVEGLEEAGVLGRGTQRTEAPAREPVWCVWNDWLRCGVQHEVTKMTPEELMEAKSRGSSEAC